MLKSQLVALYVFRCTYARTILDQRPSTDVIIAEIGSQDSYTIGGNHKNSIKCFFPSDSLPYPSLTLIYVCLGTRKILTHSVSSQKAF